MRSEIKTGATGAPSPIVLQTTRVAGRVRVSPSLAGVIADLAWGSRRREDDMLLVAVTTSRCTAAAVEVR